MKIAITNKRLLIALMSLTILSVLSAKIIDAFYPWYSELHDPCVFALCTYQGTLEKCLAMEVTDCEILERKCIDWWYLLQWDLNCTWLGKSCLCEVIE